MRDNYLRTTEEYEASLSDELRQACPNLVFGRFEWIGDPNRRLIIDDISYKLPNTEGSRFIDTFAKSCGDGLSVYSMPDLTAELLTMTSPTINSLNPNSTLAIYPGDGGETVKAVLRDTQLLSFPSISVPANRAKDQLGNVIGISLPWDEKKVKDAIGEVENVVLVDDVIDKGSTAIALKEKLKFPNAKWFAITPIMFSPLPYPGRTDSPSSIPGYERVFASLVLQGVDNPVPLNSLSSYVETGEKSVRLIVTCVDKYIDNIGDFANFLGSIVNLRGALGYNRQII